MTSAPTGVLAAEWLKARSLRSTHLVLGIALGGLLLAAAIAWAAAAAFDSASADQQDGAQLADIEEVVLLVPQLCLGILGVLAVTGEYATGSIRTSLTAVPRRWPVVAAKSVVVAGLAAVVGPLVVFGSYLISRVVIGDRFQGLYAEPVAAKLPLLTVSGVTVVVFALLGVGLGTVLRSTAAAVAVLVGLVYVVPMVVGNLPEPWSERIGSVMLGALPREITGGDLTHSVYGSLLSPVAAAVVLAAYAIVPLAVGLLLIRRRGV